MTLDEKLRCIVPHIRSIARHDDATLEERDVMFQELLKIGQAELDAARGRHAAKVEARSASIKAAAERAVA